METTMAATPKARLATRVREPGLPPFVSPTPTNGIHALSGRLEPDPLVDTRRQKPTVKTRLGAPDVTGSLELFASWIESAPVPTLPEGVWTFLGRAWFFIAGTSLGVLFALAVVAVSASKPAIAKHQARVAANDASVRTLIIQKSTMSAERDYGEVATNDVVVVDTPPVPTVRPRTAAITRKPATSARPAAGDLLNAGL